MQVSVLRVNVDVYRQSVLDMCMNVCFCGHRRAS